jgi:hypothetical protein
VQHFKLNYCTTVLLYCCVILYLEEGCPIKLYYCTTVLLYLEEGCPIKLYYCTTVLLYLEEGCPIKFLPY